jgi:mono/diheme cytochrome c family protein
VRVPSAVSTLALVGVLCGPASVLAADARNGQVIADRLCSLCHASATPGEPRRGAAPPFRSLATERVRSTEELRRFIRGQNHLFGSTILDDPQIEDVAAFMQTLRP